MSILVVGLVLFLAGHSLRMFAPNWREQRIAQWGANGYKAAYSLFAIAALALVIWGYGQARLDPVVLWAPIRGLQHLALLLTLVAMVFALAALIPRNAVAQRLKHPTALSVKVWALAHLLANHTLADVLLFGSFLVWAILAFRAGRQRDRLNPPAHVAASKAATVAVVVGGVLVWVVLIMGGHRALFGVSPLG